MKIIFPKGGIKNFIFFCLLFILATVVHGETQFLGEEENGTKSSMERASSGGGFLSTDENAREREKKWKEKKENDWESNSSFFLESATGSPLFADAAFVERIEKRWGSYEGSSIKVWVQYDKDDQAAKSKVDFGNGIVEIETVVEAESPEEAKKLSRSLAARRLERMYEDDEKSPIPVIENYLLDERGAPLARRRIGEFMEDSDFIIDVVEKPSGRGRERRRGGKEYKTKAKIKMVPDHLHQRAKKVFPIIQNQCGDYKLEESFVLSVIHVESYFNPRAVSHAGAIGLMQLMPQYGGQEAYKWLYKKKWAPSKNYLIDPSNNIQLGCAYLHLLHNEYFGNIKDDFKKRYASVAGYNWGPERVKKNVMSAAGIARMKDDEFFIFLRQRVPEETKNYVDRVRENEGNYREALAKNQTFR